jgi:hypothetical protein
MLRSLALAGLLVALVPVSVAAQDDAEPAAAPKAPEKKICRRAVATGSVMAKTTCYTKAQWDAMEAKSRSDLERQVNQERMRSNVQTSR